MNSNEIKTSILELLTNGGMTAAEVTDELHLQDKKSSVARCLSELKSSGLLKTSVNDEKRNVYSLTYAPAEPKPLKFDVKPIEPLTPEFDYYIFDGVDSDRFMTYEAAIEAAKEEVDGETYYVEVYGVKLTKLARVEPVKSVKVTEFNKA